MAKLETHTIISTEAKGADSFNEVKPIVMQTDNEALKKRKEVSNDKSK